MCEHAPSSGPADRSACHLDQVWGQSAFPTRGEKLRRLLFTQALKPSSLTISAVTCLIDFCGAMCGISSGPEYTAVAVIHPTRKLSRDKLPSMRCRDGVRAHFSPHSGASTLRPSRNVSRTRVRDCDPPIYDFFQSPQMFFAKTRAPCSPLAAPALWLPTRMKQRPTKLGGDYANCDAVRRAYPPDALVRVFDATTMDGIARPSIGWRAVLLFPHLFNHTFSLNGGNPAG